MRWRKTIVGSRKAMGTSVAAIAACGMINAHRGRAASLLSARNRPKSTVQAGIEGRMYPGSFDCEIEKNTTGTTAQMQRKSGKPLSSMSRYACGSVLDSFIAWQKPATPYTVHG